MSSILAIPEETKQLIILIQNNIEIINKITQLQINNVLSEINESGVDIDDNDDTASVSNVTTTSSTSSDTLIIDDFKAKPSTSTVKTQQQLPGCKACLEAGYYNESLTHNRTKSKFYIQVEENEQNSNEEPNDNTVEVDEENPDQDYNDNSVEEHAHDHSGFKIELKQFTSAGYFGKGGISKNIKRINNGKDFSVLAAKAYMETNRATPLPNICMYIEARLFAMPTITGLRSRRYTWSAFS
ncbi:unnamed protein product [Cunninghamella blakesleeana]